MGQNCWEDKVIEIISQDLSLNLGEANCLEEACLLDVWADPDLPKVVKASPPGQEPSSQVQQRPLIAYHWWLTQCKGRDGHRSHLCAEKEREHLTYTFQGVVGGIFESSNRV